MRDGAKLRTVFAGWGLLQLNMAHMAAGIAIVGIGGFFTTGVFGPLLFGGDRGSWIPIVVAIGLVKVAMEIYGSVKKWTQSVLQEAEVQIMSIGETIRAPPTKIARTDGTYGYER